MKVGISSIRMTQDGDSLLLQLDRRSKKTKESAEALRGGIGQSASVHEKRLKQL